MINKEGRLLEVGTGPGLHVPYLIDNFKGVIVLTDISNYFIESIRKY
jgi:hypothetical protein